MKSLRKILGIPKKWDRERDKYLRQVTGLVHVGANLGQERHLYADHDLEVLWVEPIPEIFARLCQNLAGFPKQAAIQALVTDRDGRLHDLNIANNDGGSSSILEFKLHRDIWPEVEYTGKIELRSITLPTLFRENRLDPGRYQALVMDTQGSELMVLEGAVPLLDGLRFIATEAADFEAYAGCCQVADIDRFMTGHGFAKRSSQRFARHPAGGAYYEILYRQEPRGLNA